MLTLKIDYTLNILIVQIVNNLNKPLKSFKIFVYNFKQTFKQTFKILKLHKKLVN
jgi:hypothetical protein